MKKYYFRLIRLICGLFLYSLGIVITIKANIGYAPWDVFHIGLSNVINTSTGTAIILASIGIVIITILLGEKIGIGTILNIILIGAFLDLILHLNFVPLASSYPVGVPMLVLGLMVISLASFLYIGSGFGAGPRDSLMVAFTKITKLPVGICRGIIEVLAILIGWYWGGFVGLGTVLSPLLIGFCIQATFKFFKFNPTFVKHETLNQTYKSIITLTNKQSI